MYYHCPISKATGSLNTHDSLYGFVIDVPADSGRVMTAIQFRTGSWLNIGVSRERKMY